MTEAANNNFVLSADDLAAARAERDKVEREITRRLKAYRRHDFSDMYKAMGKIVRQPRATR